MKKFCLILALLSLVFRSYGQHYYPMFGYPHTWYVNNAGATTSPRSQNDNLVYTIMDANGDTMVGSNIYYKAKLYWDDYLHSFDTTLFFREDTNLQEVWIELNDSGKEKLLYNYSLNKGDSIFLDFDFQDSLSIYYTKTGWYHVDSTKAITIYGGMRKALFLSNPNNQYNSFLFRNYPELEWIEEVGSTIMPDYTQHDIDNANAHVWGYWWNFYYIMLCSYDDSNRIYHNPAFNYAKYTYTDSDSCELVHASGIALIDKPGLEVSLSPNPCEDVLQINAYLSRSSLAEVETFDVTGLEIADSKLTTPNTAFKLAIDVSQFPSGVYFVRFSAQNTFEVSKFVKY